MVDTNSRKRVNLSLLLTAILRWDVVSVLALRDFVISLASFNRLSRNISNAFDIMKGTEDPIFPTSSSDCIILFIRDGENRASYFFLFVGMVVSRLRV